VKKTWESDLICENTEMESGAAFGGVPTEETVRGCIRIVRFRTGEKGGAIGHCATLFCPPIWQLSEREFGELRDCLVEELRRMLARYREEDLPFSVMVAGLGNRELTPDALGPETVKGIAVTKEGDGTEGRVLLSAFSPDVAGNTGIETVELIRGAVAAARPRVVLAVDALAARSLDRLAAVVQLVDGGISPGSGVGGHRRAICGETVGVPVIALGVPTVVRCSSLIFDILEEWGVEMDASAASAIRKRGGSLFVTPKEIDLVLRSASLLLSDAINRACET